MKRDKYIFALSFEITRRCNLNCRWCAKGEPQNIDITKEIIDKTLDEISDCKLHLIQITGGEPLLNPDMLVYLVEQIIARQIQVASLVIPTNGTLINHEVKEVLEKLADYFSSCKKKSWYLSIKKAFEDKIKNYYSSVNDVSIIVSTKEHDNKDTIDDVIEFFSSSKSNIAIIKQDEHLSGSNPIISGRMEKTYKTFPDDFFKYARIIHNEYCFIQDNYTDRIFTTKPLSISANGNVFVGCMQPYISIDKKSLFNVLNCTYDFFKKIDDWCWEHPIPLSAKNIVEQYLAFRWKRENNIQAISETEYMLETIKAQIDYFEAKVKETHRKLPHLGHCQLNAFVAFAIYLSNIDASNEVNLRFFLAICSGINPVEVAQLSKEKMRKLMSELITINNNIQKSTQ